MGCEECLERDVVCICRTLDLISLKDQVPGLTVLKDSGHSHAIIGTC